MRTKRTEEKPAPELKDLLKAYALQRLEGRPAATAKPKKAKPRKKAARPLAAQARRAIRRKK
jgi:hypothetical protein